MDGLRRVSKGGQVTTRIDKSATYSVIAKNIDRAIDSEALCDAAEINPGGRIAKPCLIAGKQLNGIGAAIAWQTEFTRSREQAQALQYRRYRDVEITVRALIELVRL